ncbi:MAG: ScaI family restriction endonuclease [Crocosphaera sp.]|jgi:hypothetical protein
MFPFPSPYAGYPEEEWLEITQQLVKEFPLSSETIILIVESAWEDLYSSSKGGLYGNRSTGHPSDNRIKYRTGYYLVINYKLPKEEDLTRTIWKIRFGWIDDQDWLGQKKATGQQASIGAKLARLKLITLKSYQ